MRQAIKQFVTRLIGVGGRFLSFAKRPLIQKTGLLLAAVLFAGGMYWSWQATGLRVEDLQAGSLLVLLLLVLPLIILSNIFELYYSAALAGAKLTLGTSARVSILSSAVNLLPLPAGPLMRGVAIREGGGTTANSVIAVFFPAFIWMALGFLITGVGLTVFGAVGAALVAGLIAAGIFTVCAWIVQARGISKAAAVKIVAIKLIATILDTCAIYLAFRSLAVEASFGQAMALSASGPLGSAVSVVPAGLGIRELAASGLGVMAGLTAAQAFLAPSLYRVVYLVALSPLALVLALFPLRRKS